MSPTFAGGKTPSSGLPSATERWLRRGLELCRIGRHDEALEPLAQALALSAQDPGAPYQRALRSYYGMALALARGDLARGRRLCEEAIADGPLDADLYSNLARVYLRASRRDLAVEALTTSLLIDPKNATAVLQMDRLGRRRPPVFWFLARSHPLNRVAGRLRHRWLARRLELQR